jgi:transposase-like protein
MKKTRPQLRYSEEFKRMVVEEIESGIMNVSQACRYYGINGAVSIYKWINLYGKNEVKGRKVLIMTHKEESELITLRRELALLKKQLEEAELRAIAWKSMVDAIEEDLGLPVKKKPWSQALLDARQQLYPNESGSAYKDTVGSTDSPNKPGTKGKRPNRRK